MIDVQYLAWMNGEFYNGNIYITTNRLKILKIYIMDITITNYKLSQSLKNKINNILARLV